MRAGLQRPEASVIEPHSVFCMHLGEREKRGEDTQGGIQLVRHPAPQWTTDVCVCVGELRGVAQ